MPHTCTVIYIFFAMSQQLFQCTCNIISHWAKYVHRYVPHFCFSCFAINYSTYVGAMTQYAKIATVGAMTQLAMTQYALFALKRGLVVRKIAYRT